MTRTAQRCAKCKRENDGWLFGTVELNALLCINCVDDGTSHMFIPECF